MGFCLCILPIFLLDSGPCPILLIYESSLQSLPTSLDWVYMVQMCSFFLKLNQAMMLLGQTLLKLFWRLRDFLKQKKYMHIVLKAKQQLKVYNKVSLLVPPSLTSCHLPNSLEGTTVIYLFKF